MLKESDLKQLKAKGISEDLLEKQIHNFEKGFPYIDLVAPATIERGILKPDQTQIDDLLRIYDQQAGALSLLKFVPASGAATRMFKDLFTWYDKLKQGTKPDELLSDSLAASFFDQIKTFAFWEDLVEVMTSEGADAELCLEEKDFEPILFYLLNDLGLGYAQLPKGLLQFHKYDSFARTPLEEHLVEGVQYACDAKKNVNLHFTVSNEHRGRFINHVGDVLPRYEQEFGVSFNIQFSVQKPSTDTLAVDMQNEPFRDKDGSLLFRPGGHGALIQNLNELKSDLVFIKNIDNVVPDSLKSETYVYKKVIGGILLKLQQKVHDALLKLETGSFDPLDFPAFRKFMVSELNIDETLVPSEFEKAKEVLKELLDRPIRVCGMVKNIGEPGGGPFWVRNTSNGSLSLQIVESSQVNLKDDGQKTVFEKATHFNPVDLVCGLKSYKGEFFDLQKFVDPETGFISEKSKDGKSLKAQELPGLWNGAMAHWITVFVEVPLITFNPVKTIMDLLRAEHR